MLAQTLLGTYLGVKIVNARPMNLGEYNKYKGWTIPENEDPATEGYLVVYPDGYISWCPKAQFEEANRSIEGMSFGHAVEAAKKGYRIARTGWNGKGMFVFLREGRVISGASGPMVDGTGSDTFESRPHLCMKDAQGKCVVGWLASQTDILADDWCIIHYIVE